MRPLFIIIRHLIILQVLLLIHNTMLAQRKDTCHPSDLVFVWNTIPAKDAKDAKDAKGEHPDPWKLWDKTYPPAVALTNQDIIRNDSIHVLRFRYNHSGKHGTCWAPKFNDKIFFYDTGYSNLSRSFEYYESNTVQNSKSNPEHSTIGLILDTDETKFSCSTDAFSFAPTNKLGNTTIYIMAKIFLNIAGSSADTVYEGSNQYRYYSKFTIKVVSPTKWKTTINALCKNEVVKLEDFTTTPTDTEIKFYYYDHNNRIKTQIPRDLVKGGTFLKVKDIPENFIKADGSVEIHLERTYDNGTYTAIKSIEILSNPPEIRKNLIKVTKSCVECPSGKIFIPSEAITKSEATFSWKLRKGYDSALCGDNRVDCNKKNIREDSNISGGITIENLSANMPNTEGKYTLLVLNSDDNCNTPFTFEVGLRDSLKIDTNNTHIACRGDSTGQITVNASGGDTTRVAYIIRLFNKRTPTDSVEVPVIKFASGTANSKTWHKLKAGNYSAVVMDSTCNSPRSKGIKLNEPEKITTDSVLTHPTCSDPANGSIQVNLTTTLTNKNFIYTLYKDEAPIASSGSKTDTIHLFSNLEKGIYTVKIMDPDVVEGCKLTERNDTLTSSLALEVLKNDVIRCYGKDSGRLELRGSGGLNQGYSYKLNGNGKDETDTTGVFSNLPAGEYTITLKNSGDACRESLEEKLTVSSENSELSVRLNHLLITCNNSSDGEITAVPSGGTGTYKYIWKRKDNDDNWQNYPPPVPPDKIVNLAPGDYRIEIEDNDVTGCTVTSSEIKLEDPPPLQIASIVPTPAVCKDNGARIIVTASGGREPYIYSYSLDDWITQADFTENTPLTTGGHYKIKVRNQLRETQDECSVQSSESHYVSVPDIALNFTDSLSQYGDYNVKCAGGNNGEIIVRAEGGNGGQYAGYQYKIDNREYQDSDILRSVTAGEHDVSVKDARECVVTRKVNLTQPPALIYTGTKTNINCAGDSTGIITPNATGGIPPYEIKINNEVKTMGTALTDLAKGDYSIRITDAAECTVDTVVSIDNKHHALTATVEGSDINCVGENGSATVSSTGGDGNYTFTMSSKTSSDNWTEYATWENTNPLEAGTYRFRVADGLGCTADASQSIEITTPPSVVSFTYALSDYNGYNISCKDGSNGSATLTASGGNGGSYTGYTYALDTGKFGSNHLLDSINAGMHTLRVKDARGCEKTADVDFTESPDVLSVELVSKDDVLCANFATGRITVLGKWNGEVASGLKYKINDSTWKASPTFSRLSADTHKIYVIDTLRCIAGMEVEITSASPLIVVDSISHQDIVCINDNARIQVSASGGTGMLTPQYSRNGGEYVSFTDTTPFVEGEYIVRVRDSVNCYATSGDTIRFTSPPSALTFSVGKSDYHGVAVSCHGLSTGSLTAANAAGGNGGKYSGYTYSLNGGDFGDNNNFPGLPEGTYNLRVKDGRGCISTQNPELEQPDILSLDLDNTSTELPKCGADATGKIVLRDAQGGTPSYQYSLDSIHWQSGTTFLSLLKGDYSFYVKDANACTAKKTTTLEAQYPSIVATPAITHVKCFGQSTGTINPNISGGHGNFIYTWGDNSTQAIIQNQAAGDYTLQVTDDVECTGNFEFTISQPSVLALQLEAPSICDTYSNGVITATAAGGTAPYLFSLNNQAAQEGNVFSGLTHTMHSVKVEDANVCATTSSTTIGTLNVKPEVNFLVATRKNAMDTLVIKEISIPVPNEVSWAFDPRIERISNEGNSPLIKCRQAGTYWVEMSGKWSGCDYKLKKDITINPFDPLAGPGKKLPVNVFSEVTLSPNPTTGDLHLSVKLNRRQQLTVYIYSMASYIIESRQYEPRLSLEQDFTFSSEVSSGTYIMRVIAENDSRDIRFVLTR